MTILLADKQMFPMELLDFGPLIFEARQGHIQIEKLPEVEDDKE